MKKQLLVAITLAGLLGSIGNSHAVGQVSRDVAKAGGKILKEGGGPAVKSGIKIGLKRALPAVMGKVVGPVVDIFVPTILGNSEYHPKKQ